MMWAYNLFTSSTEAFGLVGGTADLGGDNCGTAGDGEEALMDNSKPVRLHDSVWESNLPREIVYAISKAIVSWRSWREGIDWEARDRRLRVWDKSMEQLVATMHMKDEELSKKDKGDG